MNRKVLYRNPLRCVVHCRWQQEAHYWVNSTRRVLNTFVVDTYLYDLIVGRISPSQARAPFGNISMLPSRESKFDKQVVEGLPRR